MFDKKLKETTEEPQVTTLNLPIDLAKKFKKNLEPLAVSLLIKHQYGDSLLKDTTIRGIANTLRCSKTKATKIRKEIKSETSLFNIKKNGQVIACSYKTFYEHKSSNNGKYDMICASIVKFQVSDKDNIRTIKKKLQNVLLLFAVNAIERIDSSKCKKVIKSYELASKDALTYKKAGHMIGASKETAKRRLKALKNTEVISVNVGGVTLISDVWNEEIARELGMADIKPHYDKKSGLFYVCKANEYSIIKGEVSRSFRFYIRNHRRLLTSTKEVHVSKAKKHLIIDDNLDYVSPLMAMFNL